AGTFSLNGAAIAATLEAALLPFAPSLGVTMQDVTISPTDGQIQIEFLPGSAHVNGGIDFGTTSPDGTVIGAINVVPEPGSRAVLGGAVAGLAAIRRRKHGG